MGNRVEEVFSPERLRLAWKEAGGEDHSNAAPNGGVRDTDERVISAEVAAAGVLVRLGKAVAQCFPVNHDEVFGPLLELLEQKLQQRFPPKGKPSPSPEECATLNDELEQLMNQIEDLVEALEIGSGS